MANNGDRLGPLTDFWSDTTMDIWPDWVQVTLSGMHAINRIDVFTVQDDYLNPVEPTLAQTFTLYGAVDFDAQYWTGSEWLTVPGGHIVGNNHVWVQIRFPAITTDRIRVLVTASLYSLSRIVELEAWRENAAFSLGASRCEFSRNPLRPGRSSAMLQPQAASTGGEKIGHDYVVKNDLVDLEWRNMPGADLSALLTFWRDTARGMALPFTWLDAVGVQRAVRFNTPAPPDHRERAYDCHEVRCQLRIL